MKRWDERLARALRDRRMDLKLTLKEVGTRMGVETNCIWRWETGKNRMYAGALVELAEALEIGVDDLVKSIKRRGSDES